MQPPWLQRDHSMRLPAKYAVASEKLTHPRLAGYGAALALVEVASSKAHCSTGNCDY
jgi:hypothetical protein